MHFYSEIGQARVGPKSVDEVLKHERDYANATLDAKRMLSTIVHLVENQPPNAPKRLLDVGCGYGFFSKEALRQGFEVHSLEVSSNQRAIAEQMTRLKPIPLSFEDFAGGEGTFRAILMSQVLEHALDVRAWVQKAYRLIARKGVLAIALPNFGSILRLVLQERDPYICPPEHLNFFNARSLSTLLGKQGFVVQDIQWISRIDPNVVFRRIPLTRLVGSGIRLPLNAMLSLIDLLHVGMMINIYAQKP